MSAIALEVSIVVLFALSCGLLVLAWMRGRLGVAGIVLFAAALVVWIATFGAIATEFIGANEFATCSSDCGVVHYATAIAVVAPPLLISLAALAMLVSRGSRWRARRATAHENQA